MKPLSHRSFGKKDIVRALTTRSNISIDDLCSYVSSAALVKAVRGIPSHLLSTKRSELEILARPTDVDTCLRLALWNELAKAMYTGTAVSAKNVYSPFCTYTHWHDGVLTKPAKLAWMLAPMWDVAPREATHDPASATAATM